jgi:hypothetical protein
MIHIDTVDELIRLVLLDNSIPTTPHSLELGQHTVNIGMRAFELMPGVIAQAIQQEWLVQNGSASTFQFNFERTEEWQQAEDARIKAAEKRLLERGIRARFAHFGEWRHSKSPDHAMRGFVFEDREHDRFLVTLGGDIIPAPQLIKL